MIRWLERHNKLALFLAFLTAGLIFYLSSLTFPSGSKVGTNLNALIYHISIFFIFGLLIAISIVRGKYKRLTPISIFVAILYGVLDEMHQLFVPGRQFSLYDIFLDSFGILLASTLYLINLEYRKQLSQES